MKEIDNLAFQGDVMFMRVDALPNNVKLEEDKTLIVAHSETGHNHVVEGGASTLLRQDPMTSYLVVNGLADVVHKRSYDTHETLRLKPGVWRVGRQREHTPEGWRRVED